MTENHLTPTHGGLVSRLRPTRSHSHTFRHRQNPPTSHTSQEFIDRAPTETTILRLSRATPNERVLLARRVVDRCCGEVLTVESAEPLFRALLAYRAGMRHRGQGNGDGTILQALQGAIIGCITRENARDMATMMHTVHIEHLGCTAEDWRTMCKPLMSQILNHGFVAVAPRIRITEEYGVLVTATTSRHDRIGEWLTVTNMPAPEGTHIPDGAHVLVPYPYPRPLDWRPDTTRHATIVNGEQLVFVHPSIV